MEKKFVFLAVTLLLANLVIAQGNWDDFSNDTSNQTGTNNKDIQLLQNISSQNSTTNNSKITTNLQTLKIESSTTYTLSFYIAMAVAALGIIIFFYILFSLLKRPKNKFKK